MCSKGIARISVVSELGLASAGSAMLATAAENVSKINVAAHFFVASTS